MGNNLRYTLVRSYHDKDLRLRTEELGCKTLKEAVELGGILTMEEKVLGSYIFDSVRHKKLTLKGEE